MGFEDGDEEGDWQSDDSSLFSDNSYEILPVLEEVWDRDPDAHDYLNESREYESDEN